jgi:hypothetical protein
MLLGLKPLVAASLLVLGGITLSPCPARAQAAPAQPAPVHPLEQAFGALDLDPAIPHPDQLLGFPLGQQAASVEQIHAALQQWAAVSDRLRVVEYARSHQGRPLSVAIVSSPENLARLDQIQDELHALADPRGIDAGRARAIIERAPAVAYIGHSIHGNETSGGDAALGLIYGLIAARDPLQRQRLADTVLLIDPMMNPDGRARAVADLKGFRGAEPNYDGQSMARGTSWPYGRGNHYVFDMNRDWIFASQPETQGRLELLQRWHPLVFIDAHEMGAEDTFLFSPARAPMNPHLSPRFLGFARDFGREQAAAFDRRGWVYYSGEWNEGWYPGYSDAWAGLRGAVNILYEQARVADFGVRQANGVVQFYADGVARQLASAVANIDSMRARRDALLQAFWDERRALVADRGDYARTVYAIDVQHQPSRGQQLLEVLRLQGVEVQRLNRPWSTRGNGFEGRSENVELPSGSLLVSTRQPLGRLAATLMEFDPRIDADSLKKERAELLRSGEGTIYDITAWSLPMFYGLPAWRIEGATPAHAEAALPAASAPRAPQDSAVGWLIPGEDDGAVAAAARLLRAGLKPRVAHKDLRFDGIDYPRGSLVVTRHDHPHLSSAQLLQALGEASARLQQAPVALRSGEGPGDLPDLGGGEFGLLQPATVAVLGKGAVNPHTFGAVWHYLEHSLGVNPSLLDESAIARSDLRAYRVIVLPERWGGGLPKEIGEALDAWVEAGGTLIALGNAAGALAREDGLSAARTLPEALKDLKPYRDQLAREWMAQQSLASLDADPYARGTPVARRLAWSLDPDAKSADGEALVEQDRWQQRFMPVGTFVAARCDSEHWLSFGCRSSLPVLVDGGTPLMAAEEVSAPFRYGRFRAAGEVAADAHWSAYGWGGLPPGQSLDLRLGGLLWPEAQERIAHTAWVTQESKGSGQIILFATSPVFRGASLGMQRVLGNAVVYGPGLGAQATIAH